MNDEASPREPSAMRLPWWQRAVVEEPLSAEALAWAVKPFGPNAHVVAFRRMTGGLVSSVHLLDIADATGRTHEVVLRRLATSRGEHGSEMIRQEAHILQALASTGLSAPVLLDLDATGQVAGGLPSLLMTRVPGEINLAPRDSRSWLQQMAQTLARIHSARLESTLPIQERKGIRGASLEAWMSRPDLWQRAFEIVAVPPPSACPRGLVHGDYQHFNLLWTNDVLTGVVDWGSTSLGCPDSDVGHCRLNLAVLFSPDWAESFRLAYESEMGRKVDVWWDLAELVEYSPDWQRFIPIQVAGRIPVDTEGMTERVETLIEVTLERLGG